LNLGTQAIDSSLFVAVVMDLLNLWFDLNCTGALCVLNSV
jgi:hypothetical protein